MSRQFWGETLAWATAAGTAVANTTTETAIFSNVTVPANYMADGRALRMTAMGAWGIQAAANTLRFRVRWGGTTGTILFDTGTITGSGSAVTNGIWRLDVILQTRSNGSSGSIMSIGSAVLSTATAPTIGTVGNYGVEALGGSAGASAPAAATVDLTADTALCLSMTWGTANASNTVTGHVYTLEALN